MKIEIDQSGKIETTSVQTIIADSLGNYVFITAKTKREIQKLYRQANKPRKFVIETFCFLVAKLIQISYQKEQIYILDLEYPGKDKEVKKSTISFLKKLNILLDNKQIRFLSIGKKSLAHQTAYK